MTINLVQNSKLYCNLNRYLNITEPEWLLLDSIYFSMLEKDQTLVEHTENIVKLCERYAEKMRLNFEYSRRLVITGCLHDIGKSALPKSILSKPGRLTPLEYEVVKSHVKVGCALINSMSAMEDLSADVLYHHERWNGSGYPEGLTGYQIPLISRMIAIVDSYEAMTTSKRVYHRQKSVGEAKDELISLSGILYDPRLVDTFVSILD